MYFVRSLLPVIAVIFCFSAQAQKALEVTLKNAKGESVGTAKLTPLAKGTRVVLDVKGLPEGEHAFHFHETGTCTPPSFDSAGGHFNPKKSEHGFDSKTGPHAGDMPNLVVPASGSTHLEVINTLVVLGTGPNSLQKPGGTALIIHAGPDDYKSQPAGNAGARLVCGEIKSQ